jgi:hypothetical protein
MSNRVGTENKYAVFYAHGDKFIRAAVEDGSVRDKLGTTLRLNVRSMRERCASCPTPRKFPCCTHLSDKDPCVPEETREYKIAGIKVFEGDKEIGGDDGIAHVLNNREWENLRALKYDRTLFDWYYALNILGMMSWTIDYLPFTGSIIVDLE